METILFYDVETTGLPDWKSPSDSEAQPHIVQLGAILADVDTRKVLGALDLIVRPDGWDIPAEVTEIHGISTELALDVGVPEDQALEMFLSLWNGRGTRIAHNRTFDQRILRIATKRYSDDETIERWAEKSDHDCTMFLAKHRLGWGKAPKLSEAYEAFLGVEMDQTTAHTAMADARACMELYWAMQDSDLSAKASA